MNARRWPALALLLLGAAGCSKTSARPGLKLAGPSAVAVFQGFTNRDPAAMRHYLAVANERGDDLRILDALDGKAVLAPGLVMSLAVPTAPRPAQLVAGSLGDGGPDLLVVAPTGLATCDPQAPARLVGCLQLVDTWGGEPALVRAATLVVDDVLPGGEDGAILSLVAMPVPQDDGAGHWTPTPGRVRLAAGLAGGRLLLADYARVAGSSAIEPVAAAVHVLGLDPDQRFDAVSLSASPDLVHLYAASLEPILGVEGVAELDVSGPVGQAPGLVAIQASAPTTHVLAARVRPFQALVDDKNYDEHAPAAVIQLYAALDPTRCGRDKPVTCGLEILDRVTRQPLPDPAGELPSRLPIAFPGEVLSMAAIYPPAVGSFLDNGVAAGPGVQGDFQLEKTALGDHYVSTLAAVATTKGNVILVDLARGALSRYYDILAALGNTNAARVSLAVSATPDPDTLPQLGLWDGRPGGDPSAPVIDNAKTTVLVTGTAGYLATEGWNLTWQTALPGLDALRAQVQGLGAGAGLGWLAVQSATGSDLAQGPYRGVGQLYDPRLAVHVGDIVVVVPGRDAPCPRGKFELEVTGFLRPDPALYPGGAVTVAPRPDALQPTVTEGDAQVPADPHCLDAAPRSAVSVSFLSGGLMLVGSAFGYAGRPEVQPAATAVPGFRLAYDPAATAATCPRLDDPSLQATECDLACRAACERLLISRKARRQFYVAEKCFLADVDCVSRWSTAAHVFDTGPVLAFSLGWSKPGDEHMRGTALTILTSGGQVAANNQVSGARVPISSSQASGAVLPAGMTVFDRAGATDAAADGVRVFTAYTGNQVLEFSPSSAATSVSVHR